MTNQNTASLNNLITVSLKKTEINDHEIEDSHNTTRSDESGATTTIQASQPCKNILRINLNENGDPYIV